MANIEELVSKLFRKDKAKMANIEELVGDFHYKYVLDTNLQDDEILDDGIDKRRNVITEEYNEVMEAFNRLEEALNTWGEDEMSIDEAHEHLLKELCDLTYVIAGTAIAFNYGFNDAFNKVHESNMTKTGDVVEGKLQKGLTYVAPDLQSEIYYNELDSLFEVA
jgi:predicted HAD superfamily Cof-like phosphohydrolase